MKYIIINRCQECPYRDFDSFDSQAEVCNLLISRPEVEKLEVYDEGELFPKFCPLKDIEYKIGGVYGSINS